MITSLQSLDSEMLGIEGGTRGEWCMMGEFEREKKKREKKPSKFNYKSLYYVMCKGEY